MLFCYETRIYGYNQAKLGVNCTRHFLYRPRVTKDWSYLFISSSSASTRSYPERATQKMMAVTPSKQWIHFFLSDLWPPTSNILNRTCYYQTVKVCECIKSVLHLRNKGWGDHICRIGLTSWKPFYGSKSYCSKYIRKVVYKYMFFLYSRFSKLRIYKKIK